MLVLKLVDFHEQLKLNNLSKRTSKEVVKDCVKITREDIVWEHRIIKNVVFEKIVLIYDADLICGLSFEYCEFKAGVVFNNISIPNFDERVFSINASLVFYECKATRIQLLNGTSLNRALIIDCKSEVDDLVIVDTVIGNGGIKIKESVISKSIDFSRLNSYSFSVNNSVIKGGIRLSNISLNGLSFLDSEFSEKIKIYNLETKSSGFTLNRNVFKKSVIIESSRIEGLFIHEDEFLNEFKVILKSISNQVNSSLKELYITEAKFLNRFILDGKGKEIEKVTLPITTTLQGVIKLDNFNILELYLSGVNENLNLIFKRIGFKKLSINDFSNNSEVTFSNSFGLKDSLMEVVDTDLGGAKFNDFSFKSFNKLKINNAFLNNIVCINTEWFDDEQLEFSEIHKGAYKVFRNKREIYRQIKQALSSSGNLIDSLNFKARELSAYDEELTVSKTKSFGDKIIMSVSRTNNYGLSWLKPTWLIIRITLISYTIMLPLFSKEISYAIAKNWWEVGVTFSEWINNFDVFWQLFNPARKFSSTFGGIQSGWLQFLDLIHRIVLGVFIFQIIKGFRKYVSK